MAWGDIAQLIIAGATVGTFLLSWWNNRKIEQVHLATNGMKSELVAEVRAASEAKGVKEGRAQEKAEHK